MQSCTGYLAVLQGRHGRQRALRKGRQEMVLQVWIAMHMMMRVMNMEARHHFRGRSSGKAGAEVENIENCNSHSRP